LFYEGIITRFVTQSKHKYMEEYNFKKALLKSQEAVVFMGDFFKSKVYEVDIPELVIAPYIVGAFSEYADQGDMFLRKDGEEIKLEIKNINTPFTTTWPYKDVIVNSYPGYQSKIVKPDVHIILNKDKTHYISIRNETFDKWELRRTFDRVKQKDLLFYYVDKKYINFFKI
jgi:hypothetical protein